MKNPLKFLFQTLPNKKISTF